LRKKKSRKRKRNLKKKTKIKNNTLPVVRFEHGDRERAIRHGLHGMRDQYGRSFTTEPLNAHGPSLAAVARRTKQSSGFAAAAAASSTDDGQVVAATG